MVSLYLSKQESFLKMSTIEQQVRDLIKKESQKHESDREVRAFMEADHKFQEMVNKGLAKRRGNNLLSIEDSHLKRYAFNSKPTS